MKSLNHALAILATAIFGVALSASTVQADTISINFQGGRNPATGPEVTNTAGYLPVGNWNNGTGTSGTLPDLVDDSGDNSGASVTWQTLNPWDVLNGDGNGGDADLMSGYLDNFGAGGPSDTITISGVPYALYNVYVYFNRAVLTYTGITADDGSTSKTLYAKDTGNTYPLAGGSNGYIISTDDTVDGSDGSWTAANGFQFSHFTGSTLTLDPASDPGRPGGDWKVYIQGIQIEAIPPVSISTGVVSDVMGVEFSSVSGHVYQLEIATDPVASNWVFSGASMVGTGTNTFLFDPAGFSTQKLYRVLNTGP